MNITAISDLHGHYPKLEGGDLLIIAGDLTAYSGEKEIDEFSDWLESLSYKKIVVIGGNHDWYCETFPDTLFGIENVEYLSDSGIEFEGLKIWGSPWTKSFTGMNPRCKAFTVDTDEELSEKWALIPDDVDILVTHCPPYGMMDDVKSMYSGHWECVGSKSLISRWMSLNATMHVFGHIHEGYGIERDDEGGSIYINASHVNERYEPVNKPIRIELDTKVV